MPKEDAAKKKLPKPGKPFHWHARRGFAPILDFIYAGRVFREAAQAIWPEPLAGALYMDGPDPLVYLYRHTLELYIKGILYEFGPDLKDAIATEDVAERGHDLCKQVGDLVRVGEYAGRSLTRTSQETILQLHGYDPDGSAFRYPSYGPNKPKRKRTLRPYNVRHFVNEMERTLNELDDLYDSLEAEKLQDIYDSEGV